MSILNITGNNVRALQSRTAWRGKRLAELEGLRQELKARVKGFKNSGLSGILVDEFNSLRDDFDLVRTQIYNHAYDQRLDRQLLKTQYHVQGLYRPIRAKHAKRLNGAEN